MNPEQIFIGCCLLNPQLIDLAVQDGLTDSMFTTTERRELWLALLKLRTEGKHIDVSALYLAMGNSFPLDEISQCEKAAPTSAYGKSSLKATIEAGILRQVKPAINDIASKIADGESSYEDIRASVDNVQLLMQPSESQDESLDDILDSAVAFVNEQLSGEDATKGLITTGIDSFDRLAGGIQSHEYVVIGARTSTGKSSFINQMAGHNMRNGKRVAIFTLETSSKSVVLQMAGQRAGVNLRALNDEIPERVKKLQEGLRLLREKPLLVFDHDLTLDRIEARCRLLAANFKPDVVFIDYLGLIKAKGDGAYERMTTLSKAMIPLRKTLGCAMVVAAQLNRGNEKENRPPSRTDFRDTGSIEEDAHRIIAIHRPKDDPRTGIEQDINGSNFYSEIYQLKLRDGNLAHAPVNFNARHTRFEELN